MTIFVNKTMKPRCAHCGGINPTPIRDLDGDLIYWFRVEEDEDGREHLCSEPGDDHDGEPIIAFTGITTKSFDYDGSYKVICPECALEECEYIRGELVDEGLDEDGWMGDGFDSFSEDDDEDEEEEA